MSDRRNGSRRAADTRTLPHNLEAEKGVLGSILIENAGYDKVAGLLDARHFFRDAHRRIYTVFGDLVKAQTPIDLIPVKEALAARRDRPGGDDWLEEVGGPAYVASLVDGVPRAYNIRYYAEIVREKAALRKLIDVGDWLIQAAYDQQRGPHQLLNEADLKLTSLAVASKLAMGAVELGAALSGLTEDLDQRILRRGQITGFPTGSKNLDAFTHGWQRRHMVVIAGQTSFGKSVLALNTALAIAQAGGRVVYYSYEMPARDLQYRLLSQLTAVIADQEPDGYAAVPLTAMLWGNIRSEREWAAVRWAYKVMESLPIEINDSSSRSIADARAECRQIKAERGLAAAVFDHFQLTDSDEGENRTQQLGDNSRRIQDLGHELDIVTLTLSQLTVDAKDANREPQLEDLRECKSLGHDANLVIMLHPYKPSEARGDLSVVPFKALIRKNRGGRLGLVTMNLERDYVRFVEAEPPAKEAPAPRAEKQKAHKSPTMW